MNIKTRDKAIEYAIEWQRKFAESDMGTDWKELCDWTEKFTALAEKFDLTEEFEENGIL